MDVPLNIYKALICQRRSVVIFVESKYLTRRGGVEVAGWTVDRTIRVRFRLSLIACVPSDCKEVKDVFGRPDAHIGVGSVRLRPLAAHGVGCPAAGQNWETGQLFRHCIAEISLKVTLNNNNQPTNQVNTKKSRGYIFVAVTTHREKE